MSTLIPLSNAHGPSFPKEKAPVSPRLLLMTILDDIDAQVKVEVTLAIGITMAPSPPIRS